MTASDLSFTANSSGYTIYLDGEVWIVQNNGYFPYPGETMADKAQAHINAILAAQEKAETQKSEIETLNERLVSLESAQIMTETYLSLKGGA